MNPERLLFEYRSECAESGVTSLDDIYTKVKSDIKDCTEQLQAVEPIRVKLRNLQKIEEKISKYFQEDNTVTEFDDDSEESQSIRRSVIDIIKGSNDPLTNRDVMTKVSMNNVDAYSNDAKIIRCIKNLFLRGVIEKNDRRIIKGPKWNDHEKFR